MTQQGLVKDEKVGKIKSGEELKTRLDLIDRDVVKAVTDGYKQSRLRIELGMWDKGEAVSGVFTGVKTPPSWRELERQTGRDHKALKRWFDIFMEYSDRMVYLPIAEKKAEKWTKETLLSSVAYLVQGVSDSLPKIKGEDRGVEFFKCLASHYNGREPDEIWLAECQGCLKIALCRQIVSITQEFFKRWDKEHKGGYENGK